LRDLRAEGQVPPPYEIETDEEFGLDDLMQKDLRDEPALV
jgi:hypothetical protein